LQACASLWVGELGKSEATWTPVLWYTFGMFTDAPGATKRLGKMVSWLVWMIAFAIAYAQSPLFTSNQNQYFLHGLARAGLGRLNADWLANTLDPTPVFSLLVEWCYRIFQSTAVFYAIYAVLMGIYLYSLYIIASHVFAWEDQAERKAIFLGLVTLLHSAGWRYALSQFLSSNWTYVLEDGVADQRMLGTVLQPSAFGVLLLLSVAVFLRGRLYLALALNVLAASMHPTYLFSAGVLSATYLAITWRRDGSLTRALLAGLLALLMVAPILIYTYTVFAGGDPQAATEARHILVSFRIPHHALFAWWWDGTVVFKVLMVLAALWLSRRSALFSILMVGFASGGVLTLVQVLIGSEALALLFPWRISILLVPLSLGVILGALVLRIDNRLTTPIARRAATWGMLTLTTLAVAAGIYRFAYDIQRQAGYPERPLMAYVQQHQDPQDVYLIPIKMQDFRLATGAPVFVDFKAIPYKDTDVLEWHRRVRLAERFYKTPDCQLLEEIASSGHVTHLVWPANERLDCPALEAVYQDEAYWLFQIKHP
jgi:hypothetical protein